MPDVPPGTLDTTDWTKLDVLFCKEVLKLVHSGIALLPTKYKLPVNLAGAKGSIGGPYCGLPSICSCQFAIAADAAGWRAGTIAFA